MDDSKEQQNQLCRAASEAERAGRLAESAQLYREAIGLQQTNPTPYLFLGFVLQAMDRVDEAAQVWSLAADIDARLVSAWRNPQLPADIRQRSQAADTAMPYLEPAAAAFGEEWEALADSLNWGAFHIYKQGVANPRLVELFPTTLAILNSLPLLKTGDGPREILFSVLQAGQHIPPHYGLSNTDVTVHLPIDTNSESAIKVCDQTYQWQQGKVFAFDDAFHHESWNNGATTRVNLLFEAWHPDLSPHEQGAISACFDAREQWNSSRSY